MNTPPKNKTFSFWSLALCGLLLLSCSTEKDAWINRTFHQTTTKFNGYFNAGEKLKEALFILDRNYPDDFSTILPVLKTGDEKAAQGVYSYMDEVILKCSSVIQFHSMEVRRKERNKWIDENYLLIGKARFYKQEYASALQAFDFVTRNFPKETGAIEARVWLARTHLQRGNINTALGELEYVKSQKGLTRNINAQLYSTLAWAHIEIGNYVDAIENLQIALGYTRSKTEKIRYTFILAQLNQRIEEFEIASALYKRVTRYNPPYEFTFNAKINKARCFDVFSGSSDQIVKELERMIKDDKNIEYLDQIYYALADVFLRDDNTGRAIEYLKLSVKYSAGNQKQLGVSYYGIGDLYFGMKKYVPAQLYYDSASRVLPIEHPEYNQVVVKRNSLSDLVKYVTTISAQDSLQELAVMSESERNRVVDRIIKEVDEQARLKEEQANNGNQLNPTNNGLSNPNANAGGAWYFYNTSAMSVGFSDFQSKWGRRNLEDNWRRKNKQSQASFSDEPIAAAVVDPNKVTDPKKREFYTQNIPLSKEAMKASNASMEDAYYKLGLIYMNKLEDYRAAIKTFKELTERFPGSTYELRAFYNLYKLYELTGYRSEMELYEAKIFKKYPDSDLANLMRDPDYFDTKSPKNKEADSFYKVAYTMYKAGDYDGALSQCVAGKLKYTDNAISPKLGLLEALAVGKKYGNERMEEKLRLVVSEFGGHEVSIEAQNLLNYLARKRNEATASNTTTKPEPVAAVDTLKPAVKPGKEQGKDPKELNEPAKEEELPAKEVALEQEPPPSEEVIAPDPEPVAEEPKEVPSYYKFNEAEGHMYVLVVPVEGNDINQFKTVLSNFNGEKFSLENLIIKNFQMGKQYQLITVRGHKSIPDAMSYFRTILNDGNVASVYGSTTFEHFIISQSNFGTFYGKRDISGYKLFFEANLLTLQTEN